MTFFSILILQFAFSFSLSLIILGMQPFLHVFLEPRVMLKLLKFGPAFGVPDPSVFVMKLETYLRLAKLEYESKPGDVRKAPKGKFPVLIDGASIVPDSQFAIDYLKDNYGDPLNDGVNAAQQAHFMALRLGLENHSYFLMLMFRWLDKDNALLMGDTFFSELGLMKGVIFKMVQSGMRRTIEGQGLLRHAPDELDTLVRDDITMLEHWLGEQPFFGGERPGEIDCTTFAFIANMIVPDIQTPQMTKARQSAPLIAYHNRMVEEAFPDYKDSMLYQA